MVENLRNHHFSSIHVHSLNIKVSPNFNISQTSPQPPPIPFWIPSPPARWWPPSRFPSRPRCRPSAVPRRRRSWRARRKPSAAGRWQRRCRRRSRGCPRWRRDRPGDGRFSHICGYPTCGLHIHIYIYMYIYIQGIYTINVKSISPYICVQYICMCKTHIIFQYIYIIRYISAISKIAREMGREFSQWCCGLSVRLQFRAAFPHHVPYVQGSFTVLFLGHIQHSKEMLCNQKHREHGHEEATTSFTWMAMGDNSNSPRYDWYLLRTGPWHGYATPIGRRPC